MHMWSESLLEKMLLVLIGHALVTRWCILFGVNGHAFIVPYCTAALYASYSL